MELNLNCIRDTLLKIEELHQVSTYEKSDLSFDLLSTEDICTNLPQYSISNILYTLLQLDDGEFISLLKEDGDNLCSIYGVQHMTYKGHEFLSSIRDPKQWSSVEKVLTAIRNYSLSAVSSAAEGITSAALNAYLSGPTGF